jgi:hypothetical protein
MHDIVHPQVASHMANWRSVREAGIIEMNGRTDIEVKQMLNPHKLAKLERLFEEGSRPL